MSDQTLVPAAIRESVTENPEKFFTELDIKLGLSTRFQKDEGIEIFDKDDVQEIKERLSDLGYKTKCHKYEKEQDPFGIKGPLTKFQKELGVKSNGLLTRKIEKTLSWLVGWEGERENLRLPGDLDFGSQGVFVRSVQYRLKTLGFYHSKVDGDYGPITKLAVISFKKTFGVSFKEESAGKINQCLFRLLSNPYALNAAMVRCLKGQPVIVRLLKQSGVREEKINPSKVFISRGKFRIAGKHTCSTVNGFCEPMQPIHELNELTRPNRQAVYLIQLWLWMMNFYHGRLDGIFGPESLSALVQYLSENSLESNDFLIELQNNYIAISMAFFHELGLTAHDMEEVEIHEKYLLEELENMLAHESRVQDDKGFFYKLQKKVISMAKRIYWGTKSIIVRVGRIIARGAKWVWEKVGKLGGSALHLMCLAISRVRKSMAIFWKNLRDLYNFLDKRTIVTKSQDAVCISMFQKDFDMTTIHSKSSATDLIIRHAKNLNSATNVFSVACKVVGIAISTVVNALKGPVGWLQIAVVIARQLYSVVKEYDMSGPLIMQY